MPKQLQSHTSIEWVLKRDRLIVITGLAAVSLLAWAYMFYLAGKMGNMKVGMDMALAQIVPWEMIDLLLTFVMWTVMMVAMMVPSASPMVLLLSTVNRKRFPERSPLAPTAIFVLGYLVVWTLFSLMATLAQWGLHSAALLSPTMVSTSPILGAAVLIAAGLFQWTPLKSACLRHCRSPLEFLTRNWREGIGGALLMGLRHGGVCTGCCWALMALLFVAGVMNLLWVGLIAIFVLAEKIFPGGDLMGRAAGGVLVLAGLILLAGTMHRFS
ncbi:MAG: DUF2182 domain-containing protein [Acidobacteria bacterium]|nr:DUF2182 domain-containing protein [Acidobacteriota bacterium]